MKLQTPQDNYNYVDRTGCLQQWVFETPSEFSIAHHRFFLPLFEIAYTYMPWASPGRYGNPLTIDHHANPYCRYLRITTRILTFALHFGLELPRAGHRHQDNNHRARVGGDT